MKIGKYKISNVATAIPVILLSGLIGYALGVEKTKLSIRSGPYSDSIYEAQRELNIASSKIQAGDLHVEEHIKNANSEISKIKVWSEKFVGINSRY